jgi:DNA integrity scanning protein DisA with diadenylate cyclase activity
VFHPELRAALARLGQSRMIRFFNRLEEREVVEELVEAVERLARAKIGAIIAIQRDVGLDEYAETGTRIHARVGPTWSSACSRPTARSTTAPCSSTATPSSPPA